MAYLSVEYKKFVSQRRFGVELETSNTLTKTKVKNILKGISSRTSLSTKYQLSGENNFWHIKDDATCGPLGRLGPKGVEIASFVAKGIEDLQHIAEVSNQLYTAGCRVNDNCGLHIHAEVTDVTPYQMGVILAYWIKMEFILSMAVPLSRWSNPYCKLMLNDKNDFNRNKSWTAIDLWNTVRPTNLALFENPQRRVNLNLVNYSRADYFGSNYRKTLELRWPEGTLNGRDIKCWVRLFLNFIDVCKNLPMPANLRNADLNEALTYLGLNHGRESFAILSEGLHDTKSWFLQRIVKFNHDDLVTTKKAKRLLNLMWSPIIKYA